MTFSANIIWFRMVYSWKVIIMWIVEMYMNFWFKYEPLDDQQFFLCRIFVWQISNENDQQQQNSISFPFDAFKLWHGTWYSTSYNSVTSVIYLIIRFRSIWDIVSFFKKKLYNSRFVNMINNNTENFFFFLCSSNKNSCHSHISAGCTFPISIKWKYHE